MKVCFVAHNAYGALRGVRLEHVGGIERQQALFAKWLAEQGHDVSMIVWGQQDDEPAKVSGVNVQYLCKVSDGIPVLRFVHPRWTSLIDAMKCVDADVYYYNLGDMGLGQVVLWSKFAKKTVVYSVSSEPVCRRDLRGVLSLRERIIYKYGLRNVDKIIVQTTTQAELLKSEYGLESELLPMPCSDLSRGEFSATDPDEAAQHRVVWVGRLSKEKRPDWLIAVARACPAIQFDVIGQANRGTDYADRFLESADELDNVHVRGVVQHQDLFEFYRKASLLICTSAYEGLPNVFLEAWSMGLPTVTSFDPGGIVAANDIGFVGTSPDDLADKLRTLLADTSVWSRCSANAGDYFRKHHELGRAMPQFARALGEAA